MFFVVALLQHGDGCNNMRLRGHVWVLHCCLPLLHASQGAHQHLVPSCLAAAMHMRFFVNNQDMSTRGMAATTDRVYFWHTSC